MQDDARAFLDEMHRPALPYKFKFKFSGCPNDCVNAIHRSDFAVIGTTISSTLVKVDPRHRAPRNG